MSPCSRSSFWKVSWVWTRRKWAIPDFVEYVKDMPNAINEIIERVDSGKRQIAFFTNPVKMDQLIGVTDAGERMPHKSTYFYPKMFTGLTIQKLEPMDSSPMVSTNRSQDRRV